MMIVTPNEIDLFINRINKIKVKNMTSNIEVPELTDNENVNKQLLVYFWWLIVLSFIAQCINFLIQFISGTITGTVLLILCLGAIQTLLIGGGAKMVQKQMDTVSGKYNAALKSKKESEVQLKSLTSRLDDLEKQLTQRDAELISLKIKTGDQLSK
jgi:hypothetical protein